MNHCRDMRLFARAPPAAVCFPGSTARFGAGDQDSGVPTMSQPIRTDALVHEWRGSVRASIVAGLVVFAAGLAGAQGVVVWGDNSFGQIGVTGALSCVEITAGSQHSIARRGDGTIRAW